MLNRGGRLNLFSSMLRCSQEHVIFARQVRGQKASGQSKQRDARKIIVR